MANIEGIKIRNFKVLKDVTLGKLWRYGQKRYALIWIWNRTNHPVFSVLGMD